MQQGEDEEPLLSIIAEQIVHTLSADSKEGSAVPVLKIKSGSVSALIASFTWSRDQSSQGNTKKKKKKKKYIPLLHTGHQ
jgi:hypothetical protein